MLPEEEIEERLIMVATDMNRRRTSLKIPFAFGEPQPIKEIGKVGMKNRTRLIGSGVKKKINETETRQKGMEGRDGAMVHATEVATGPTDDEAECFCHMFSVRHPARASLYLLTTDYNAEWVGRLPDA